MMISVSKWKSFEFKREADAPQRRHRIGPVAAVELAERVRISAFCMDVSTRLPTYLYSGIPPRSAPNARHHPAAEDRVGLAVAQRGQQLRHLLRRVLAVAVQQDDEVEPALDRERVADLLVAAVALVELVAQHRHPDLGVGLLVLASERVGPVFRRVVDDQDLAVVVVADLGRDAIQHGRQRRLGEVRDDEHKQPRLAVRHGVSVTGGSGRLARRNRHGRNDRRTPVPATLLSRAASG